MLIAKQKKKENIAEYILYMWQLEDLLRAYDFDIERIDADIVSKFKEPLHVRKEIKEWYKNLGDAMKAEKVEKMGHLLQLSALVQELSELNILLLQRSEEKEYNDVFNEALPNIAEIVDKSGGAIKNEIEACFVGLYALLMLRLKGEAVSDATQKAMNTFSKLLAVLSKKYREAEEGKIEL